MSKQQLSWQSVDTNTLPHELAKPYAAYLAAKKEFEKAMVSHTGCDLAFSYKHGELSIAKVERKVAKGKISLAEFNAMRDANGERR